MISLCSRDSNLKFLEASIIRSFCETEIATAFYCSTSICGRVLYLVTKFFQIFNTSFVFYVNNNS